MEVTLWDIFCDQSKSWTLPNLTEHTDTSQHTAVHTSPNQTWRACEILFRNSSLKVAVWLANWTKPWHLSSLPKQSRPYGTQCRPSQNNIQYNFSWILARRPRGDLLANHCHNWDAMTSAQQCEYKWLESGVWKYGFTMNDVSLQNRLDYFLNPESTITFGDLDNSVFRSIKLWSSSA